MSRLTKFLGDTIQLCVKHNVELKLIPSSSVVVDANVTSSGYFDDTSLVVATKRPDWVDVLVHETCHLDQYIEKAPCYKKGEKGIFITDDWLDGRRVSKTQLVEAFKNIILMELDCEQRTVKKIKKYKLNINLSKYIQQSNSYLFSYWATYRDRKWYPFPYSNPKIVKNMPKKFLSVKEYMAPYNKYLKLYK